MAERAPPAQAGDDFAAQFALDRVFEDFWVPALAQLEEMFG